MAVNSPFTETCNVFCFYQVGKEHLGLKAITEVLQDLQYKVSVKLQRSDGFGDNLSDTENLQVNNYIVKMFAC